MQYITFGRFFFSYRSVSSKIKPCRNTECKDRSPKRQTFLGKTNFTNKSKEVIDIFRVAKIETLAAALRKISVIEEEDRCRSNFKYFSDNRFPLKNAH